MSSARWECWRQGISRSSTIASASSLRSRASKGFLSFFGGGLLGLVVLRPRRRPRAAPRRCRAGSRGLLLVAVHALGVLAQRRLQPGGGAQHHVVHRAAVRVHGDAVAADHVARARVDAHGRDAADERVGEADVGRVDRVERAHLGGDRVGHLVGVLARPALALPPDADVGVRVDEAGAAPSRPRRPRRRPRAGLWPSCRPPRCGLRSPRRCRRTARPRWGRHGRW